MIRTSTRKLLRIVAFSLAMVAAAGTATAGNGKNAVTGLSYEENEKATAIHIAVSKEPTFSVFKLRNPSRLLVEVSDCEAGKVAELPLRNGVLDKAAVVTHDQRCRVIITFDNDASYDVDATSETIVVSVDATHRQLPGADNAELEAKLANREAELQRTKGELANASEALEALRSEREEAARRVEEMERRQALLEAATADAESKAEQLEAAQARIAELEELESELNKARSTSSTTQEKLQATKQDLETAREHLVELKQAQQQVKQTSDELAAAESELSVLRRELAEERARAAELGSKVDGKASSVAVLEGQIDALKNERDEAREKISRLASERDQAARRAEVAETRAGELEQEVARLRGSLKRKKGLGVEKKALKDKLSAAESRRSELEAELTDLQEQVANGHADAETRLAAAERRLRESSRQADTLQSELAKLEKKNEEETARLKQDLEAKEAAMEEARAKASKLKKASEKKVAELASALKKRDAALEKKEAELQKLKEQESELIARLAGSEGSAEVVQGLKNELNELKRKQARLTTEMEREMGELKNALAEREAALARAKDREVELKNRYESLQKEREKEQVAVTALIESKESQLQKARANEAALREEVAALQESSEMDDNDPALNTALFKKEAELKKAVTKQQTLNQEVKTLAQRLEENRSEVARVKKQADAAAAAAEKREQGLEQEIDRLDSLAKRTESRLEEAQQRERQLEEKVATLNEELQQARKQSAAQKETMVDLREKVAQAEEHEAELKQLQDKLAQAEAMGERADEMQERIAELEARTAEINQLKQELAKAERVQEEMETLRERAAEAAALKAEMDRLRSQADEANAARAELRKLRGKVSNTKDAAEELEKVRARLEDAEKARSELAMLKEKLRKAEEAKIELSQVKQRLAEANQSDAEVERLRKKLGDMEKENAELAELRKKAREAEEARAEVGELQQRIAQLERQQEHIGELEERAAKAEDAEKEVQRLKAELASAKASREKETRKEKNNREPKGRASSAPLANKGVRAPLDTSAEGESSKSREVVSNIASARVKDIRFEKDGRFSRVFVELDGKTDYHTTPWGDGRATLVLEGAGLPDALSRKLDTRAFKGPVDYVSSFVEEGNVHLVAELAGASSEVVRVEGNTLVWEFAQASGDAVASNNTGATGKSSGFVDRRKKVRIAAAEPRFNTRTAPDDDITVRFGKRERLRGGRLSRRRISLDVRNANINDLLRLIADEANVSIITSPDVQGSVTLSLKSVPLDQALDIILRAQDLGMKQEGNILWVAPAEVFREEQRQALEAALVREKLEPLEVRLLPVNYAEAGALRQNVASLLSERGSVQIDQRTNTLIIKDVAANLDAAEILVESLDTQTPQILIEARVVETQSNYTKELGVQWGGDFSFSPANGNPTGLVFPSTIGVAGGSTADQNTGTAANPNFAVNLPAAVGTGSGGAVGMTFGSIGGAVNLNLRLSALEEKGFVKIVSAPRVMTLDNQEARIEQGVSIPVSVVSAAGVQTQFFDANLTLQVTPSVTKDGNVFLDINVTKNEPDFANTGANGDPSIIRKEAQTQLLVPDGDTTVIGGIYTRNQSQGVDQVPFFGDIPFIGYFFRTTSETDNRTELLIFITPRIINRESSIGVSGPGSFLAPEPEDSE